MKTAIIRIVILGLLIVSLFFLIRRNQIAGDSESVQISDDTVNENN